MAHIEAATKRARGRPPVRSDDETRHLIAEAARREFLARGFAGASVDDIAKSASVSKKTLYRLIPTKADLFRVSVTDRIARFMLAADDEFDRIARRRRRDGAAATEYGNLTLSAASIALQKLAIAEADRFPELAVGYYADAIQVTQAALAKCLAKQCELGELELDDPYAAAGMLGGMMVMEPLRAVIFARRALLTPGQIAERARTCVRLFLGGCLKDHVRAVPAHGQHQVSGPS